VSKEANLAIFKAVRFAILDSINIPLYRGHTVYYPSKTKFVRTKISIFPRPLDFGITASPILTEACELLGINDITVKVLLRPAQFANLAQCIAGAWQHLTQALWSSLLQSAAGD
jgi:ribosomal protein S5